MELRQLSDCEVPKTFTETVALFNKRQLRKCWDRKQVMARQQEKPHRICVSCSIQMQSHHRSDIECDECNIARRLCGVGWTCAINEGDDSKVSQYTSLGLNANNSKGSVPLAPPLDSNITVPESSSVTPQYRYSDVVFTDSKGSADVSNRNKCDG